MSRIFVCDADSVRRFGKVHFGESFSSYLHIKALRTFVESVLRYGLPVNFQSILIQPKGAKYTKRILKALDAVFTGTALDDAGADADAVTAHVSNDLGDWYSYVLMTITLMG